MAVPSNQQFDYVVKLEAAAGGGYCGVATTLQGIIAGLAGPRPEVRVSGDVIVVRANAADAPPSRWLLVPLLAALWIPVLGSWLQRRHFHAGHHATVRAFTIEVPGLGVRLSPGVKLRIRHQINAGPDISTTEDNQVTLCDVPDAPVLAFACPIWQAW